MPRYGFHSGKVTSDALEVSNQSNFKGRQKVNVTKATGATYTVKEQDYIIGVSASATTACTITIPTDLLVLGRVIIVDDLGGGANSKNITIGTESTEKIDGGDTATISTNYGSLGLYSDGTNWFSF